MAEAASMTSNRPYLIRAIHAWIADNDCTPYLLVDAGIDGVVVPREHVDDGRIVLNISSSATDALQIDNDAVSFRARFGGRPMQVVAPIGAVLAIYARENGQGMMFPPDDGGGDPPPDAGPERPGQDGRPSLKIVK